MFFLCRNITHIYDAVELPNIKVSPHAEYEMPSMNSDNRVTTRTSPKQEVNADAVKLQENPSYKATDVPKQEVNADAVKLQVNPSYKALDEL